MNPGSAGRTELPDSLKASFRSVSMMVPDLDLIIEILLLREGFEDAKVLSRKVAALYNLAKEQLAKKSHYDWGLRAITSVARSAGALKRADLFLPEDQQYCLLVAILTCFVAGCAGCDICAASVNGAEAYDQ
eukprot:2547030-Rhodomonas_salina.2